MAAYRSAGLCPGGRNDTQKPAMACTINNKQTGGRPVMVVSCDPTAGKNKRRKQALVLFINNDKEVISQLPAGFAKT